MTTEDPKIYMIIEVEIIDPEAYSKYAETAAGIIEKHGGRYLIKGGRITPVSGGWSPKRIVLIEFPSVTSFKRCFASDEYLEIVHIRRRSIQSKAIYVEGL